MERISDRRLAQLIYWCEGQKHLSDWQEKAVALRELLAYRQSGALEALRNAQSSRPCPLYAEAIAKLEAIEAPALGKPAAVPPEDYSVRFMKFRSGPE